MPNHEPCPTCGKSLGYSVSDVYRYAESGLSNVYLQDIETVSCECGESPVIRAVPSLLRIIAFSFASKPARLRGNELKFLRHIVSEKAKDFANSVSITPEHLSRIEASADSLPSSLDKLVRAKIVLDLVSRHRELVRLIKSNDFMDVFDRKLPKDDENLGLFVKYRGLI